MWSVSHHNVERDMLGQCGLVFGLGFSFSETTFCVSQTGPRHDLEILPLLPLSPECEDCSCVPLGPIYVVLRKEPMCAGTALPATPPGPGFTYSIPSETRFRI